jgi:precorrin-3B C17-methyltransferase
VTGWVRVVGLGPGDAALVTPEATAILGDATDVLGYFPYVARVAPREGLTLHGSDNRQELERARAALALAAEGRRAAIVSSGDPGVFAMAAAVFEAVEHGPPEWAALDVSVAPGITAMLAAAARVGAPLGHDFCAINLSDNLKPWAIVERRVWMAAEAGFAIALYNPSSKSRPHQFAAALAILRDHLPGATPVIFARAVSTADESIAVTPLSEARPEQADMRTLVIVGSAATRVIARPDGLPPFVYTPRGVEPTA